MKKRYFRYGLLGLLAAFLLYMIIGGAVVPLFRPESVPAPYVDINHVGTDSERVLCIDDNEQALLWRLRVIELAKENLIFTTFNFQDDESGKDIMAALLNAAEHGVHVRMVVDGFTVFTSLRSSQCFAALSQNPNVEIRIYNPVNLMMPWKLNYRMHDKYIVADDVAYILGGRNTHNLSLGDYQENKDVDRDILVYGTRPDPDSSLNQVKDYFEDIWNLPEVKPVQEKRSQPEGLKQLRERYESLRERYPEAYAPIDWQETTYPSNGIRLIHNPVEAKNKPPMLWETLMDMMSQGERSVVQTPYMICNKRMYTDLYGLRKNEEGPRIVLNSVETGANLCGCVDYLNQKKNILNTGMEVYEYVGSHSSHAKTVLIDDSISVVGSFNFDMRSVYLDTETMLVIDSPELTAHLHEQIGEHMDSSRNLLPDGTCRYGPHYEEVKPGAIKMAFYHLMRLVVLPFRHLL